MEVLLSQVKMENDSRASVRIFHTSAEFINLILPFLALPFFIFESTTHTQWNSQHWNTAMLFMNIAGLGSIHTYFTVTMMLQLPEFKSWWSEQTSKHSLFPARVFIVSVLLVALSFLSYQALDLHTSWFPTVETIFLWASAHHSFAQSLGLSQVYTMKIGQEYVFNDDTRKTFACLQHKELKLRKILMATFLIWTLCMVLASMIAKPFEYAILFAFLVVLFLYLHNSFSFNQLGKSNKFIFTLRLLLYPLSYYNQNFLLVVILLRFLHGIEYFGVFQIITSNTQAKQSQKKNFLFLTLILSMLGAVLVLFRKSSAFIGWFDQPWMFAIFGSLSVAMVYIHFFLDGLLFKMKDPISRKWIAPLLNK